MGLCGIRRILLVAAMAASVAACGRAGDPEPPAASVTTNQTAQPDDTVADRPFVLDPLI